VTVEASDRHEIVVLRHDFTDDLLSLATATPAACTLLLDGEMIERPFGASRDDAANALYEAASDVDDVLVDRRLPRAGALLLPGPVSHMYAQPSATRKMGLHRHAINSSHAGAGAQFGRTCQPRPLPHETVGSPQRRSRPLGGVNIFLCWSDTLIRAPSTSPQYATSRLLRVALPSMLTSTRFGSRCPLSFPSRPEHDSGWYEGLSHRAVGLRSSSQTAPVGGSCTDDLSQRGRVSRAPPCTQRSEQLIKATAEDESDRTKWPFSSDRLRGLNMRPPLDQVRLRALGTAASGSLCAAA
jgi:hypothetical protein